MTTETETNLRGALESTLVEYVRARDLEASAKRAKDEIASPIKSWLEQNPGEVLVDGEHGITAELQHRATAPVYDLITIYETDPVLFERLIKTGCLQVNGAAVKAQGAQVAGVDRFASPGGVSTALTVKTR